MKQRNLCTCCTYWLWTFWWKIKVSDLTIRRTVGRFYKVNLVTLWNYIECNVQFHHLSLALSCSSGSPRQDSFMSYQMPKQEETPKQGSNKKGGRGECLVKQQSLLAPYFEIIYSANLTSSHEKSPIPLASWDSTRSNPNTIQSWPFPSEILKSERASLAGSG
jgi:hypothetical protein